MLNGFWKDLSLFIPLLKLSSTPPRVANSTLKVMIQTDLSVHHRRMLLHIFFEQMIFNMILSYFLFQMYSDVKLNPFFRLSFLFTPKNYDLNKLVSTNTWECSNTSLNFLDLMIFANALKYFHLFLLPSPTLTSIVATYEN